MNTIPNNLDEAIVELAKIINEQEREIILSDQSAALHHTVGRFLRNAWQLWDEASTLNKWFNEHGIHHADDMTAVIFRAYRRKELNKPYNIADDAKHYQVYWAAMNEINESGKLDVKFVIETNEYGERVVRIAYAK